MKYTEIIIPTLFKLILIQNQVLILIIDQSDFKILA